jgi:hypothetical protein
MKIIFIVFLSLLVGWFILSLLANIFRYFLFKKEITADIEIVRAEMQKAYLKKLNPNKWGR